MYMEYSPGLIKALSGIIIPDSVNDCIRLFEGDVRFEVLGSRWGEISACHRVSSFGRRGSIFPHSLRHQLPRQGRSKVDGSLGKARGSC